MPGPAPSRLITAPEPTAPALPLLELGSGDLVAMELRDPCSYFHWGLSNATQVICFDDLVNKESGIEFHESEYLRLPASSASKAESDK